MAFHLFLTFCIPTICQLKQKINPMSHPNVPRHQSIMDDSHACLFRFILNALTTPLMVETTLIWTHHGHFWVGGGQLVLEGQEQPSSNKLESSKSPFFFLFGWWNNLHKRCCLANWTASRGRLFKLEMFHPLLHGCIIFLNDLVVLSYFAACHVVFRGKSPSRNL